LLKADCRFDIIAKYGLSRVHVAAQKCVDTFRKQCFAECRIALDAGLSFRDALKSKRCIVPVSGFCEYTGPKGGMTKHTITRAGGGPLFLAGLWASHTWEDERTESYTMLMMEAEPGDDMRPFHTRQPIVLDRNSARTWLDLAAPYQPILKPGQPGSLAIDPPEPVTG
jgi:putative SOS response-associated peptidase YedK